MKINKSMYDLFEEPEILDEWIATCFWNRTPKIQHSIKEHSQDEIVFITGNLFELHSPIGRNY